MARPGRKPRYPSDLTDEQWNLLQPLIPPSSHEGRTPFVEPRDIVDAILYVLRSGCSWRMLPHDFPAWQTVYWYFLRWEREGVWDHAMQELRMQVRVRQGRDPEPSAAVIDSQTVRVTPIRGPSFYAALSKVHLRSPVRSSPSPVQLCG